MESEQVMEFRREIGLGDSRNEYTMEQILALSTRTMFCTRIAISSAKGTVNIVSKKVLGYISQDSRPCIFVKDDDFGKSKDYYMPMKNTAYCDDLGNGVYFCFDTRTVYSTNTAEKSCVACLKFASEKAKEFIDLKAEELQAEIDALKGASFSYTDIGGNINEDEIVAFGKYSYLCLNDLNSKYTVLDKQIVGIEDVKAFLMAFDCKVRLCEMHVEDADYKFIESVQKKMNELKK